MLNVIIPTDHPDAGNPLLQAAARALVRMGARVEIHSGDENLVRRLPVTGDARDRTEPIALVRAEGLRNLLHELVHAVQAGRLDDDHGIDYTAIPFDLETPAGRAVLWDELSCCVVSCAYLWAHGEAARGGESEDRVEAEVDAWFEEQIGIQPVFYGMDGQAFRRRVAGLLVRERAEAEAVLARAYAATERALTEAGADSGLAAAPRTPTMHSLWPKA